MDPADWPIWVKVAAGWGPLGAGWVRAEIARVRAERAHHKTRDGHTAAIEKLNETHQQELRDLTDRFVQLIEKQAAAARVLANRVQEKKNNGGAT